MKYTVILQSGYSLMFAAPTENRYKYLVEVLWGDFNQCYWWLLRKAGLVLTLVEDIS